MTMETLRSPGWLRHLRIGVRLRLVFFTVVLLMLLGSLLTLWQFREIGRRIQNVSQVEQRMMAVLRLDNSILEMMNKLHRAADTAQSGQFEEEATRLLAAFRSDTMAADRALQYASSDPARQALILGSLNAIIEALPGRIRSMIELAHSGDWSALHARLLNQVDHTDDVVAVLVRQLDGDLSMVLAQLEDDIQKAQRRAAETLITSGLLSLIAAILMGLAVTRSITQPLAGLETAEISLALGNFSHRVDAAGHDELSHLAHAYNRTTGELERLYQKVLDSEARFRSLIEKASDLIVVVSPAGELSYASPSLLHVLGYAPAKLLGQPVRDLLHPDEVRLAAEIFSEAGLVSCKARPFDLRFRHQDGTWRSLTGTASNLLDDPAIRGIVVNARDVTERRQAEQKLRERDDQLRQAQKMEAIGLLAGGVAHDFNNLLTVINGYSELLLAKMDIRHELRSDVREIRNAGERAAQLTRQLLAFSRKQVLEPAVLDLNDIVREVESVLRRIIGEDIDLICKLEPSLGGVEADASQLHQVIMNLAVNARDAMPLGGRLVVETANTESEEGRPGRCVMLAVTDTGHGMDEATRQRVFEPFFTKKERGKGTGLGLSTVYGIIAQSGGQIAVESEVGRGTTFRIHFPRVERSAETAAIPAPSAILKGSEVILIVEDQSELRRFASTCLQSYGYRVMEAADGDEAIRLFEGSGTEIDLVLTDVVMPGMNGVELSRKLHSLCPGLRVIYASGYADSVILQHGIHDEGGVFLQKPYTPDILATKIRDVLDGPSAI
jgi:PAS domain S-box-containing protein